jgi:hypothetical protein
VTTEYVDASTGEVLDLDTPDGVVRALLGQQARIERLTGRLGLASSALEAMQQCLDDTITGRAGVGGVEFDPVDVMTGWTWAAMGPMGAENLWRRLASWVGWLRGRYPLAEALPGCWWRHPELVEEITALHLAWRAAYSDPTAALTAPIDWHAHHLPAFLARVRTWGVHCTDAHRDRPDSLYDANGVDRPAEFDEFIADDARRRQGAASQPRIIPTNSAPAEGSDVPNIRHEQVTAMAAEEITALVATGRAERLGDLPGAPVLYGDRYWLADGARYVRVEDDRLHTQLAGDHRRLRAAGHAVMRAAADTRDGS